MLFDDLESDDDGDFLGGDSPAVETARCLQEAQRDITAWAAAALVNRYPDVVSYRGKKGLLACRQDLDFHVSHLHTSLASDDLDAMSTYSRWIAAVVAQRGVTDVMLGHGIEVLAEAFKRFLPWPHGKTAADTLVGAFARDGGS